MSAPIRDGWAPGPDLESDEVVVLVDETDRQLGSAPKFDVHVDGRLHRAVSVVLFDDEDRILLQRRARSKYHSAGLWSNAACGHPRPGEAVLQGGLRRLREEMGIEGCALTSRGHIVYRESLDCGLIEHEVDHVLVGRWRGDPRPDASEVSAWRWAPREELLGDIRFRPDRYTAWLSRVLERAVSLGA
jgi:isopentenyl-diphosphate Delta-isomerase